MRTIIHYPSLRINRRSSDITRQPVHAWRQLTAITLGRGSRSSRIQEPVRARLPDGYLKHWPIPISSKSRFRPVIINDRRPLLRYRT